MKKIIIAAISLIIAFTTVISVFAEVKIPDEMTVSAGGGTAIMPLGTDVPTDTWNIATKGQYNISGYSESEALYTEYRFTGCNTYTIKINNNQDTDQTVKIRRASDGDVIDKFTVEANDSTVFVLTTSHIWYLEFTSSVLFGDGCNVSGYIKN